MKWVTRERVKVDRVACPWLIKKFVDPVAEFLFVPADQVMETAERLGATPYDVLNVELGHHGQECSFEAILRKHNLTTNLALVLLGKIVNGADTDNALFHQPEGPGLEAIAEGLIEGSLILGLLGQIEFDVQAGVTEIELVALLLHSHLMSAEPPGFSRGGSHFHRPPTAASRCWAVTGIHQP